MITTGKGAIAGSVLMAMDLLCFPMMPFVLTALTTDTFG
jgi:hypothetical protein